MDCRNCGGLHCCESRRTGNGSSRDNADPIKPLRRYIARYNFWAQKIYRQYYHRRKLTPDWLDRS